MSEQNQNNPDDVRHISVPVSETEAGVEEFSVLANQRALYEENRALKDSLTKSDRNFYILLLSLIVSIIAFIASILVFTKIPKTQYIATADNTAICNVLPQDNPNYTNENIRNFAQEAVTSLYTFSFLDADARLADNLSLYFTESGKESISRALNAADLVGSIKRTAKNIRGYPTSAPIITEVGDGFWKVQFNFTIEVYGASPKAEDVRERRIIAKVVPVTRSVTNYTGLGIESIETTGITQ